MSQTRRPGSDVHRAHTAEGESRVFVGVKEAHGTFTESGSEHEDVVDVRVAERGKV